MAVIMYGDSMISSLAIRPDAMAPFTNIDQVWVCPSAGTAGNASYIKSNFFDLQTARYHWSQVIWSGHHISVGAQAEADKVSEMIDALDHDKFVVISAFTNSYITDGQGPNGALYLQAADFNAILLGRYPQNYFDLKSILVADGVANEDAQSVLYDGTPSYWAPTDVHFNDAGCAKAALELFAFQESLGHFTAAEMRRQILASGGV